MPLYKVGDEVDFNVLSYTGFGPKAGKIIKIIQSPSLANIVYLIEDGLAPPWYVDEGDIIGLNNIHQNIANSQAFIAATSNIVNSAFQTVLDPSIPITYQPSVIIENFCVHEYKHYQGILEAYNYCVKCDYKDKS